MKSHEEPKICVVMAAKDAERTIQMAVESILTQDYTNFTLAIVTREDDTSTNQKVEELSSSDTRIVPLLQSNTGISNARNAALESIDCDLFTFLDSDDRMFSGTLAKYAESFINAPETSVRYCDWKLSNPSTGHRIDKRVSNPSTRGYKDLIYGNFLATCATAIDADVVKSIGGFNESYKHGEDWDLWLRASARFPVKHVNHVAAEYRQTKSIVIYPRSFFQDELSILRSQQLSTLNRWFSKGLSRGRYGAYWIQTIRSRRSLKMFFDVRPQDLIWLPAVAWIRHRRFRSSSRERIQMGGTA
jgi:glycosyltransferase involved in cell wall biosynthesis